MASLNSSHASPRSRTHPPPDHWRDSGRHTPDPHKHPLAHLGNLQVSKQATIPEVMAFIEREKLYGLGCGLIDTLLLTSTILTQGATLWTLDKRLAVLAERFGVAH